MPVVPSGYLQWSTQVALSSSLPAVLDVKGRVDVYDIDSGRRLIRRDLFGRARRNLGRGEFALAGDKLIVWDGRHVSVHDPRTGTEEQLVRIPAGFEGALGPRRLVTALTTDETRVAWAETDTDTGRSVVRVVDVA